MGRCGRRMDKRIPSDLGMWNPRVTSLYYKCTSMVNNNITHTYLSPCVFNFLFTMRVFKKYSWNCDSLMYNKSTSMVNSKITHAYLSPCVFTFFFTMCVFNRTDTSRRDLGLNFHISPPLDAKVTQKPKPHSA